MSGDAQVMETPYHVDRTLRDDIKREDEKRFQRFLRSVLSEKAVRQLELLMQKTK
jgi:hypothetical protein